MALQYSRRTALRAVSAVVPVAITGCEQLLGGEGGARLGAVGLINRTTDSKSAVLRVNRDGKTVFESSYTVPAEEDVYVVPVGGEEYPATEEVFYEEKWPTAPGDYRIQTVLDEQRATLDVDDSGCHQYLIVLHEARIEYFANLNTDTCPPSPTDV